MYIFVKTRLKTNKSTPISNNHYMFECPFFCLKKNTFRRDYHSPKSKSTRGFLWINKKRWWRHAQKDCFLILGKFDGTKKVPFTRWQMSSITFYLQINILMMKILLTDRKEVLDLAFFEVLFKIFFFYFLWGNLNFFRFTVFTTHLNLNLYHTLKFVEWLYCKLVSLGKYWVCFRWFTSSIVNPLIVFKFNLFETLKAIFWKSILKWIRILPQETNHSA